MSGLHRQLHIKVGRPSTGNRSALTARETATLETKDSDLVASANRPSPVRGRRTPWRLLLPPSRPPQSNRPHPREQAVPQDKLMPQRRRGVNACEGEQGVS